MPLRLFVEPPVPSDAVFALPEGAARHAQVRRVQPGDALWLFDGSGREWPAEVVAMGRSRVDVRLGAAQAVDRELPLAVTLALGMPANERMDALVEKAAELGAARLVPLVCERSVLRLDGERAEKKRQHWQAVAIAACEQSGRARLMRVEAPQPLARALAGTLAGQRTAGVVGYGDERSPGDGACRPEGAAAAPVEAGAPRPRAVHRWVLAPGAPVLSADEHAPFLSAAAAGRPPGPGALDEPGAPAGGRAVAAVVALSGPEGGLTPSEVDAARACGFVPVGLGPRVLRADTAPLALLAWLALQAGR